MSREASTGDDPCKVSVAVRVRPMAPHEQQDGCERAVVALDDTTVVVGADKTFTFNHAFSDRSTQEGVFDAAVRPLLDSCLDGYNATIFAYGQTVRAC